MLRTRARCSCQWGKTPAIAIFARPPLPGKAKTRLIPLLGSRGAAELHAALIRDTLRKVQALSGRVARYLFVAGLPTPVAPARFTLARQRGAGLGERLENAFRKLLHRHPCAVVLGTDSPLLPPRILREALRELRICDAVLGPCPDGGYYLIGLRRPRVGGMPGGMFRGIRWGTRFAFGDTLRRLLRYGFPCSVLESLEDVDRPEDVQHLREKLTHSRAARRLAPATWRFLKDLVALSRGFRNKCSLINSITLGRGCAAPTGAEDSSPGSEPWGTEPSPRPSVDGHPSPAWAGEGRGEGGGL
jgi:hypothetical protein